MPTYLVSKEVYSIMASKFSTVYHICLTIFKNDKAKFKAVYRKYSNTHSFYSAHEFFMCKDYL